MFSPSFQDSFFVSQRLVPSAQRSEVVPELWGPYFVECIKELFFYILSVCKGMNFISLFAQPGVLHVSESSLYYLAYV